MPGTGRVLIGFAASAVVAALAAVLVMMTPALFTYALALAAFHVAIVAVPAYFLLRRQFAPSAPAILTGAFLTGFLPLFLFLAISSAGSGNPGTNAWSDGVQTVSDGVLTLAGWLQLVTFSAYFGACGLAGGLAFWLITRTERPAE